MLHVCGVGDGLGVHHAHCIEGFAVGDDGRDAALAFEHEVVDFLVDAVQFSRLVPVVGELAVGVLQEEGLDIVGIGELGVRLGKLVVGGGDVFCGRIDLKYDILYVAAGLLLEEIRMLLVVLLDFGGSHLDGAVLAERIGHIDIIHVCGGVVLCDGLLLLESVLEGAGVEDGTVLRIVLLGLEGALKVVPVELETAAFVGRDLGYAIAHAVCGEVSVLIEESAVAGDQRGRIGAGGEVYDLGLADGDAGCLGILGEQVLVYEFLPGGVADLLLCLLVLDARTGDYFVDLGKPFDILEVIGIGNRLACNAADVVFAGHGVQGRLKGARVYNE